MEASSDDNFPIALTRLIVVDLTEETATTDQEVESIVLLRNTGVVLKACSEHDDLTLTLHGAQGEELNRYVVDIGEPAPTPVPPPTPVPGPVFDPAYETLRFCPDDTASTAALLTGNEKVGDVIVAGTNITYALTPDGDSRDYAFFRLMAFGSLYVSDAGADDHTGIDGTRLYTFVVRLPTKPAGSEKPWSPSSWTCPP